MLRAPSIGQQQLCVHPAGVVTFVYAWPQRACALLDIDCKEPHWRMHANPWVSMRNVSSHGTNSHTHYLVHHNSSVERRTLPSSGANSMTSQSLYSAPHPMTGHAKESDAVSSCMSWNLHVKSLALSIMGLSIRTTNRFAKLTRDAYS